MANIQNIPLDEKLRDSNPKINQNFANLNTDVVNNANNIENHKNSNTAHAAQSITYSGKAVGNNAKDAIDSTNDRIDNLIITSGDSSPEVSDARGGYPVLGDRLNAMGNKIYAGPVNVKYPPPPMVGAIGDGATDDTLAITNILNYAISNRRTLYIPAGVFLCDTINYGTQAYAHQVSIIGEERNRATLKKKTADGKSILVIGDTAATNFTAGLTISNITFEGISGNTPNAVEAYDLVRSKIVSCIFTSSIAGLRMHGGIANEITNCIFSNNQYGLVLDSFESQAGGGNPNFNTVYSCQIVDNTMWGVYFNGGRFLNIDSCDIEGNGTAANYGTGGIYVGSSIDAGGGDLTIGVNIENSWFEDNNGAAAIQLFGGKNSVSNSYFIANGSLHDINVVGGKYNLSFLDGDTPKTANVNENPDVLSGNFIVDCDFGNLVYNAKKTTVTTNEGRVLARGGELPVLMGVTAPLIQTGLDSTSAGVVTITYPEPFTTYPMVFTQQINNTSGTLGVIEVFDVTATSFSLRKKSISSGSTNITLENFSVFWLAIGHKA